MKQFLATYMGSASNKAMQEWEALDEKAKQVRITAGMKSWGDWAQKNSKYIVAQGTPIGKTKKANASGITDIKNLITAYTVVQAESHEAAAKLFIEHPHFTIFPGDSVEIMECLPMPKS